MSLCPSMKLRRVDKFTNGPFQKPQQVTLGSRCDEHDVFQCPHRGTRLAGCLSGCLVGCWLVWTLWPLVSGQAGWAAVLPGWLGWLDWLGLAGLAWLSWLVGPGRLAGWAGLASCQLSDQPGDLLARWPFFWSGLRRIFHAKVT